MDRFERMVRRKSGFAGRKLGFAMSAILVGFALGAAAQVADPASAARPPRSAALTPQEARTERAFEQAKKAGPPELYAFLKLMPKGADLHMHLSGAVYAETFIAEAARQGLCVAPVDPGVPAVPEGQRALRFVPPLPAEPGRPAGCAPGQTSAATALTRQPLYDDLVDSFSMRAFVPSEGVNGHDQFFATFDRYGGLKNYAGEWLDEVATRAARQNEQYLEIMQTPTFAHAAALGYKLGWPAEAADDIGSAELASLRSSLLNQGIRDEVAIDRKEFADADAVRDRIEGCAPDNKQPGQQTEPPSSPSRAQDQSASTYPRLSGCSVKVRWLYQILRGFPPQQVFAQTLLGFEVVEAEIDSGHPNVVGINFVMPEDGYLSMRDYRLQMQMLAYLHSVYQKVHITLHAGELAFGMVPPKGLSFHIREAVDLGHAERIGHGVDVLYEDNPEALLKEMAARHIMVEINLTSNAVILGVEGKQHPLAAYRAAHVPVALSTDDEGVSRIDLTHEFVRGAEEQDLTYLDLKQMARTSLEHAFLGGESLWASPDDFNHRKPACSRPITASSRPDSACGAFLKGNERASQQWELERRLAAFEAAVR